MDVSTEWMTDVSKVRVWNIMDNAAKAGVNRMDALDIVRPSVRDGEMNSDTRMLYSVMTVADSRISVCGEAFGPRMGVGRVLYRALLQATAHEALTDVDLKRLFLGYETVSGCGKVAYAPCHTFHDMNKGSDVNANKILSRVPYYFSPSSCSAYVDKYGRGYHVIHFLEEIFPETYGWINLL